MSNNFTTLTSLAMLKVNVDAENRDYLEYLRPLVLHVILAENYDFIRDEKIAKSIQTIFGLKIPSRAIHRLLIRMAKNKLIKKDGELYVCDKSALPVLSLEAKKANANHHINCITRGLRNFSKGKIFQIDEESEALEILLFFLSQFSIECLKTYVFGNTIPNPPKKSHKYIVIVSQFLRHLYENDKSLFDSFMVLVKGHMLANALTCPDLESLSKLYSKATFYLDTPVAIQLLGLVGPEKETAIKETVTSARKLGAKFAIFSHTSQELKNVIRGAAYYLDSPDGRGSIIHEARRTGRSYSDLVLVAEKREDFLLNAGVKIAETPSYDDHSVQINEDVFENLLDDEVGYYNPKAKVFDVNSVRSIYALRQGSYPCRLEDANATFVTSNTGFAKTAFDYGKQHESTKEVSSVITAFSLANITWLKSPLDASDLPKAELLSLAFAALNPSESLWTKYSLEIDKLKDGSEITADDHALLKCELTTESLMEMTLGEEDALTSRGIKEILETTKNALTKEQRLKLLKEKDQHATTRAELDENIEARLLSERTLDKLADFISKAMLFVVILAIMLVVFFILWKSSNKWWNIPNILLALFSIYGLQVKGILGLQRKLKEWFLKKFS